MESTSTEASKPTTLSFLGLPPEIRLQIYSYILPDPIPRGIWRDPLPLSIFRVNRQIHDESTHLFYTRSIFEIFINIDGVWSVCGSGTQRVYQVTYQSPWETLNYDLIISKPYDVVFIRREWCRDRDATGYHEETYDKEIMSNSQYKHHQQPGVIHFPSPRYRSLIRHIEIEIVDDFRRELDLVPKHFGAEWVIQIRTLLSPFLWRLREVLPNTASVDITFIPWWDLSKGLKEKEFESTGACETWSRRTAAQNHHMHSGYIESLEASYMFTRGPWDSNIRSPAYLDSIFPGLKEEVFAKCDRDTTFQEAVAQEVVGKINIEIEEEQAFWAARGGHLFLCHPV
ncbi:hypothetical protein TWF506_005922 [Arthrobotrys conoides]|uniref:F-box domain-containing protein n=1 Tax=Arthrobotrys conoides TaxID=74498 RepID=A0AAN8RX70_9PEZI